MGILLDLPEYFTKSFTLMKLILFLLLGSLSLFTLMYLIYSYCLATTDSRCNNFPSGFIEYFLDKSIKLTGEVVSIDKACYVDGTCSTTIKDRKGINYTISWGWGWVGCKKPSGYHKDGDYKVGDKIDVHAAKEIFDSDYLTLCGRKDYYIKKIPNAESH